MYYGVWEEDKNKESITATEKEDWLSLCQSKEEDNTRLVTR